MTVRTASCSCGQLTVLTAADPIRVSVCHCLACQRRTGSVFGAQARFPREGAEIKGSSTVFVRVADSGKRVTYHFCPACGSTVHYSVEGQDELIAIPVGAFADPAFLAPSRSVWEERMHSWVRLPLNVEHLR
jgi:hypothetical protein